MTPARPGSGGRSPGLAAAGLALLKPSALKADRATVADSSAFEFVCSELERLSQMTRLEARGTVRLALRDAGFAAGEVRPQEMLVVLMKLMPKELASRGIGAGEEICREISTGIVRLKDERSAATPEAIFSRLASAR